MINWNKLDKIIVRIMLILILFVMEASNLIIYNITSHFVSIILCVLTCILGLVIFIISSFNIISTTYYNLIVFLLVSLLEAFLCSSLLNYYIFFEISVLPIFIIILGWGYQPERLKASLIILFYTVSGSLPLLISILVLLNNGGSVRVLLVSLCNVKIDFALYLWYFALYVIVWNTMKSKSDQG